MGTMRKRRHVIIVFILISAVSGIVLAGQTINLVNHSTFSVAGNGVSIGGANYGEIKGIDWDWPKVSPSSYGGNDDASDNVINVSTSVEIGVYGGMNYPFVSSSVASGSTGVAITPNITANSNTVNISSSISGRPDAYTAYTYNDISIYGGYSLLTDAIRDIVPKDNVLSSPISMSGNTVNFNASCNVGEVAGAYLYLEPKYDSSNPITVTCPISLDGNTINVSSSIAVDRLYGAYVAFYNDLGTVINIPTISVSGNTVNISSEVEMVDEVYKAYGVGKKIESDKRVIVAYVTGSDNIWVAHATGYGDSSAGESRVSKLTATNNSAVLSKSGLNLSDINLYGVVLNVPNGVVQNYDVHDNTLWVKDAKNVSVGSIQGFDAFRFDLPDDIHNNDTVLTLNNQNDTVIIDVNKLIINNYEHFISTVNVNLIASYGASYGRGKLYLVSSNGAYLYRTRVELQVTSDNMLRFTFNPSQSIITLDPQTKVISEAGAANLTFVTQGLDSVVDKAFSIIEDVIKDYGRAVMPFAAVGASKAKYHTGGSFNNIDTNGFSVMAGVAKQVEIFDKKADIGAFFEHGNGKFETANYFNDEVDDFIVAGTGHAYYNGGGALAKLRLPHNLYFDVTGRIGNATSDYYTSDLTKLSHFSFEYSTTYYGAMACLGHIFNINEFLSLDSYAKYCLTNLAGKDVALPENQKVKFDTEHLQKVKVGSKIYHNVAGSDSRSSSVFLGAGIEYYMPNPFDASISGQNVDAPEIGGGCGVIEAGFVTCIGKLNVDLTASYANGHVKDSVDGLLKFMYAI